MYIEYFFYRFYKKLLNKLLKFCLGEVLVDWNIVVGRFDSELNLLSSRVIPNQPNSYFADPFLLVWNKKIYIFAEEFFWDTALGKISLIEVTDLCPKYYGMVLEENFHLSFPFVFKKNGKVYMAPESHQNAQVSLYEAVHFPTQWALKGHLISNLCASDTVFTETSEYYFALCNDETGRYGDRLTNLKLYASERTNDTALPVFKYERDIYNDASLSRNAGLFNWSGNTYRVNQIPSFNLYGKNIAISKISITTSTDGRFNYEEKLINDFDCLIKSATKGFLGCHHFHILEDENMFVCDASKLKFNRKISCKLDKIAPRFFLSLKRFILNV